MLCSNCIKLTYLPLDKKCIKCQGAIAKNISVLCEACSAREKICEVCLKKFFGIGDNPNNKHLLSGCHSCGKSK